MGHARPTRGESVAQFVFSENPEADQWRWLLRYSYRTNVATRLRDAGHETHDSLIDTILGSIQQSYEYFKIGAESSLFISPTQVYYGAVHLLFAASALITGEVPKVANHGLVLAKDSAAEQAVADTAVIPFNPTNGSFSLMAKVFSKADKDLTLTGAWSLHDFLGSLPDMEEEYNMTYPQHKPRVLPVEVIKDEEGRILDRISRAKLARWGDDFDCNLIVGGKAAYVVPQFTESYLVFRRRLDYVDCTEYSLSNRKHLLIHHIKNGKPVSICQLSRFQGALFALAHLARYAPQRWYPFVRVDSTGERHLIERFVKVACRRVPNLVLDALEGRRIVFSSALTQEANR